jgi:hypothetical protein
MNKKNYSDVLNFNIEKDYLLKKEHFRVIEHFSSVQNNELIKMIYYSNDNNLDFINNTITKQKISIANILKTNPKKNKLIFTDYNLLDLSSDKVNGIDTVKIEVSTSPDPTFEQINGSKYKEVITRIKGNDVNLINLSNTIVDKATLDITSNVSNKSQPVVFCLFNSKIQELVFENSSVTALAGQITSTPDNKQNLNSLLGFVKIYYDKFGNKEIIRRQLINTIIAHFEITYNMNPDTVRSLLRKVLEIDESEPQTKNEDKIKKIMEEYFPNYMPNKAKLDDIQSYKIIAIMVCFILQFNLINFSINKLNRIEIKKHIDDPNLKFILDFTKLNVECPKCPDTKVDCPKPVCNCPKTQSCPDCNCSCQSNASLYIVSSVFLIALVLIIYYSIYY